MVVPEVITGGGEDDVLQVPLAEHLVRFVVLAAEIILRQQAGNTTRETRVQFLEMFVLNGILLSRNC